MKKYLPKISLQKLIVYGLYLYVFLFFWQTRLLLRVGEINGDPWEYGSISLYASDVLLLILLAGNLINVWRQKRQNLKLPIYWYIIAFLELSAFISVFFAPDKYLAVYGYFRLLLGIGLFWLVVSLPYRKFYLLISFFCGVFIQALLGIWQFFAQYAFANKYLGIAEHKPYDLGVSVVEAMGNIGYYERWLRSYAGFDHPNIFGGVLAVTILLLIYFVLKKAPTIYGKYTLDSLIYIAVYRIFLFTAIVALIFSFSRAAWISLVLGIIFTVIISLWRRDIVRQDSLAKIILIVLVTVFILFFNYGNIINVRFNGQSRVEARSTYERTLGIKESWKIIKQNFFFGTGINCYTLAEQEITVKKHSGYYFQPVHNVYLLVLAELGIFGLVALLLLLFYPFFTMRQLLKRKNFFIYAYSWWLSLLLLMFFDHWLWSLHFGILFFWFLLGLFLHEKKGFIV